jgi:hypothetical protein
MTYEEYTEMLENTIFSFRVGSYLYGYFDETKSDYDIFHVVDDSYANLMENNKLFNLNIGQMAECVDGMWYDHLFITESEYRKALADNNFILIQSVSSDKHEGDLSNYSNSFTFDIDKCIDSLNRYVGYSVSNIDYAFSNIAIHGRRNAKRRVFVPIKNLLMFKQMIQNNGLITDFTEGNDRWTIINEDVNMDSYYYKKRWIPFINNLVDEINTMLANKTSKRVKKY